MEKAISFGGFKNLMPNDLVRQCTMGGIPDMVPLLQHCSFRQLTQIHGLLITTSLAGRAASAALCLRRSTEFGHMDYAERLFFSSSGPPHILLWNAMIRGYSYNGPHEKAIHMFDEMPQRELVPNSYTYPYVLDSCNRLRDYRVGRKIHCLVVKTGFDNFPPVGSSLLNFYVGMENLVDVRIIFNGMTTKSIGLWNRMMSEYVGVGDIVSARRMFDEMPERDVVSWNTMLSGYAKDMDVESARDLFGQMPVRDIVSWTSMVRAFANAGDLRAARGLFDEMPGKNVVSWNCMLSCYTQHGKFKQALDLFLQMQREGVVLDGYTFVSALSACGHLGALEIGKWIHFQLIRDGIQFGAIVGTALLEMYAKCGDVDRAFKIFIKMAEKDVFCWNVMIRAFTIHGRTEDAMKLFAAMKREGPQLSDFTFMSVLFACSHGGLVEEGRRIFGVMERDFKIRPKIEHYGCFIDLLCRNGLLEEAHQMMKEMPYEPDIALWGTLLRGFVVENNVELPERTMERITELKANEGGTYVLLSNMHATSKLWNEALKLRHNGVKRALEDQWL